MKAFTVRKVSHRSGVCYVPDDEPLETTEASADAGDFDSLLREHDVAYEVERFAAGDTE